MLEPQIIHNAVFTDVAANFSPLMSLSLGVFPSTINKTGNWTTPNIHHAAGNPMPDVQPTIFNKHHNRFLRAGPALGIALSAPLSQCSCRKYNSLLYLDRVATVGENSSFPSTALMSSENLKNNFHFSVFCSFNLPV